VPQAIVRALVRDVSFRLRPALEEDERAVLGQVHLRIHDGVDRGIRRAGREQHHRADHQASECDLHG